MKRQYSRPSQKAFTLIELLVVIAIIALLTALLVPTLSAGRDAAKRAVCGSNVRSVWMANQTYSADNGDYYVLAAEDIFVGYGGTRRWHGVRASSSVSTDVQANLFDPKLGPLSRYMGSEGKAKQCPSFGQIASETPANAFEAGTGGYGYNETYIGGRSDLYGYGPDGVKHSARSGDVRQPGETVMFADAAFLQPGGLIESSFLEPPYWQTSPGAPAIKRPNPTTHFRHRNYANVVFADGHVESLKMAFSAKYSGYGPMPESLVRRNCLGWFGPDSNDWWDLK